MFPFIESIKFLDNHYYNLEYHQARFDFTRSAFYPQGKYISLKEVLVAPIEILSGQLYKCRIIYGRNISEITYEAYTPRIISQIYLFDCPDDFNYNFKFADRSFFNNARAKLKNDEDFVYIKQGLVTDSSYANLVFNDGKNLFTPLNPLLKGTKRAFYIKNNSIKENIIKIEDLPKFKTMHTINAMLDLELSHAYSCDKLLFSKFPVND